MNVSRSLSAPPSGSDGPSASGGARRTERRDDAYIRAWKAAWVQGCESRWRGQTREAVPHRSGPEHDAWLAGWAWADTQPDRRDASRPASRAHARRRSTDTGAANQPDRPTTADSDPRRRPRRCRSGEARSSG